MSHVTAKEIDVDDLDALEVAAARRGCELVRGQKTYKWWGKWVNDYDQSDAAYRQGIDPKDYGKCEHVIRVKGNSEAYEVGVVKRPDGRPGYMLVWDFFGSRGAMLQEAIGTDANLLRQEYAMEVGMKQMLRQGFRVERKVNPATNRPQMRAWR